MASRTVTAAWIPETLDWKTFNAGLKRRGLVLAGGQGKLKGKIFRLGHLGSVTTDDILAAIGALEATAIECGVDGRARSGRRGRPAGAHRERGGRPMRILVVEPLAAEGLELLRRHHDVDERLGLPRDEIAAILPEYDALVVRSQVKVDAELIAAGTRLVVIGRAGVGVDNVDLEAATRAGIVVVNAPTGNTIAAAELTLALLFGLARKTAAADASMRRGEWKRSQFTGMEVRGKTLGIVGLGKIGQAIAVRARAMQMTVLGSDPFVTHDQAANLGVELVSFDDLVARSDAITVHVPKNKGTTGLINAAVIERMKPGVLLLNVARGGVIDEQDLADALRSGKVGGAGIDVFNTEPPDGLAAPRRPEHAPHAAPRRVHRRGPGRGRGGGRGADPRRPRRPLGPVRGQRAAADARDRPGDRALPAAGRDARPVRGAARPRGAAHADPRDRRRARRRTTPRRWWRRSCAASWSTTPRSG